MKWLLFYRLSHKSAPLYIARDESNCPTSKDQKGSALQWRVGQDTVNNSFWDCAIMFTSFHSANLELLGRSDILYADGTFNISPHVLYQILTIHAFKHGKHFSLAYFFLPGKSRKTQPCRAGIFCSTLKCT